MNTKTHGIAAKRFQHEHTGEDYFCISFPRTNHRPRDTLIIEASVALTEPTTLIKRLHAKGADLPSNFDLRGYLSNDAEIGTLFSSPGWKGVSRQAFVLPAQIMGHLPFECEFDENAKARKYFGTRGNLDDWKKQVARRASRSYFVGAPVLAAFAAPLIPFSTLRESFILNIAGDGSSGKSTAVWAAYSVYGNPQVMPNWHASERGVEEAEPAHNNLLLALDDVEKGAKTKQQRIARLQENIHTLTGGETKLYSGTLDGTKLESQPFSVITLTSSPEDVESCLREMGRERTDGDRARLLELRIPKKDPDGVWGPAKAKKPELDTGNASDALHKATCEHFGVAGVQYLGWLADNRESLETEVASLTEEFLRRAAEGERGVRARISTKIGLMYAGGILARRADVLQWSEKRVMRTCQQALTSVLDTAFPPPISAMKMARTLLQEIEDETSFPVRNEKRLNEVDFPETLPGFQSPPHNACFARYGWLERHLGRLASSSGVNGATAARESIRVLVQKGVIRPQGQNAAKDIRLGGGKRCRLVELHMASLRRLSGKGKLPSPTKR